MNSLYYLRDAIKHALIENKNNKNFIIFNQWMNIEINGNRKFRVFLEEIKEE